MYIIEYVESIFGMENHIHVARGGCNRMEVGLVEGFMIVVVDFMDLN